MTVSDIIAKWPSSEQFSRELGLKCLTHGRTMRRRNSIPETYWPSIIEVSHKRGTPVTRADLEAAHSKTRSAA